MPLNVIEGHWLPRLVTLGGQDILTRDLHLWVDGVLVVPRPSQQIVNHSPDGFSIGYNGSGPAQTALAVLLAVTGDPDRAQSCYQQFKVQFISRLEQNKDFVLEVDVLQWIDDERRLRGLKLEVRDG
jgi:hypothetical protein